MAKLQSFIFIFFCDFFATCLKVNGDVTIYLEKLSTKYIGKKGTLAIKINNEDKFKEDTTRKILFDAKISNGKYVECGFWKSSEYNFYVFCNIGTDIPAGNYSIDFRGIPIFNYQGYNVNLYSSYWYEFEKLDKELIDLYSKSQTINVVENKDSYEFKFNILSYNQEILMLGYSPMDCRKENDKLFCKIKRKKIEKSLNNNEVKENVFYQSDEPGTHGLAELPLVEQITLRYSITKKIDVFVGITRLLENVAEGESHIAYETNITYIKKLISSKPIELEFENEYEDTESSDCSFKKYDDNPLLIVCFTPRKIGKCWLKEIEAEIKFNDVHAIYNFRIQPVKNKEKIYISQKVQGSWIIWLYPEILNFTKRDTLYIDYALKGESYLKGITLNKEKGDLSCEIRKNRVLRCKVSKNHFDGKNGYYFTKHTNHLNGKSIFYESPPIKVILKGNYFFCSLYCSLLLILTLF